MVNIILNNKCNFSCKYCFAELLKEKITNDVMDFDLFKKIVDFLVRNGHPRIRLLGGEPLLVNKLQDYIRYALDSGLQVDIFSNLSVPHDRFGSIGFDKFIGKKIIFILNINDEDYYNLSQKSSLIKNLYKLRNYGFDIMLGYNIYDLDKKGDFVFKLGKMFGIKDIVLKPTNSVLGEGILIDNCSKELGAFVYNLVVSYSADFNFKINYGCGMDRDVFTNDQLLVIDKLTNLRFGCDGHDGYLDIDIDGLVYKCYPLRKLYMKDKMFIQSLIDDGITLSQIKEKVFLDKYKSSGECTSNKMNKNDAKSI